MKRLLLQALLFLFFAFLAGASIYFGARVAEEIWPKPTIKIEPLCDYKDVDC